MTEYVRDYIQACRRRGETWERIGVRLGVSHVWALQLSDPKKYGDRDAGGDVEDALAGILHAGSVDALRRAALSFSAEHGRRVDVIVEPAESAPADEPKQLPPARQRKQKAR